MIEDIQIFVMNITFISSSGEGTDEIYIFFTTKDEIHVISMTTKYLFIKCNLKRSRCLHL